MGYGSNVQYAYMIGKESTRGTGVTTDKDIGLITDVSNDPTRENIPVNSISQIESVTNKPGLQEGAHTVTFSFQHGRIFEFVVGDASHANTSSDWVHTFTVDNLPDTFTAQTGNNLTSGDVGLQYVNNVIESAELSCELNGLLTVSFTAKGKFPTTLTTVPAQTVSTLQCFTHKDITISINAVAVDAIQNFTINFNKVAESVNGFNSNDIKDIIPTELRIEFSGTIAFTDETYHNHFVNNDVTAITFVADNGVSLGSGKRALNLALNNITVTTFKKTAAISGLVFVEIGGVAKIDTFTTTDNIADTAWF